MNKTINMLRIGLISAGFLALFLVLSVTPQKAQAAITSQLDLGSRGNDVTELQQFLATNSSIYPEGIVSGYFGPLTQAAVTQFQVAYDIPQAGRVGPMTQSKMNSIMSSGFGLDTNAPTMSNAWMQANRTNATISWSTSEPARGQVYYDVSPIQSNETTGHAQQAYIGGLLAPNNTDAYNSQSVTMQGLQPNTSYYYVTRSTDNSGNVTMTMPNTFHTND